MNFTRNKNNKKYLFVFVTCGIIFIILFAVFCYIHIISESENYCATETEYLSTLSYNGNDYLLLPDNVVSLDYGRDVGLCYLGRMKDTLFEKMSDSPSVYGLDGDLEREYLYISEAGWPENERLYIRKDIEYPVLNSSTVSKISYIVLINGSISMEITDPDEKDIILTEYLNKESFYPSSKIRVVAYLKDHPIKVILGYE